MTTPLLTIGTRGSPLALWQANATRAALVRAHDLNEADVAVEVIRTTGDTIQDRPLSEAGGKGLFTKEIEDALLDRRIDLAVHSSKDMPTHHRQGLVLSGCLPRADARDAYIGPGQGPADLPEEAVVGTASLRRQALVRRLRPDLKVVPFRGNVETRLRKLREGEVAATFLAMAGLIRLGLDHHARPLETDDFLPAIGQGAIGLEIRSGDTRVQDLLAPILDADTGIRLAAERAFLEVLDGSCRTPIAGLAVIEDGLLSFKGRVLTPDGERMWEAFRSGAPEEAARLGADAGHEIRSMLPAGVLTWV
ncbi:hydroxymethylbilane synthase [Agaricicola taiwanensis]|nr:hydroxymethylbilane synthase [Agaricicola taiwanensis]